MTSKLLPGAALVVLLIAQHHSMTAAQPGVGIIDLGTLGGDYSDAFGINNLWHVVGQSRTALDCIHAFFWTAPGPTIDLGTLGGNYSFAADVNDLDQIAGISDDSLGQRWAVVWANVGGTWTIENLGTVTGGCCAAAYGINNGSGGDAFTVAVVGYSAVSSGHGHAVVWTRSSTGWTVQDLGTLPGDTWSSAHNVNDRGDVVGTSGSASSATGAFLWTATTGMVRLPALSGETYALAINNNGDVAGLSTVPPGVRHAVRWRSATNWAVEDLGTLGGCCSEGYGINGTGDVVGVSNISQRRSGSQHAFLANSTGMTDLGTIRGQSAARDVNVLGGVVGSSGASTPHAVLWRLQ